MILRTLHALGVLIRDSLPEMDVIVSYAHDWHEEVERQSPGPRVVVEVYGGEITSGSNAAPQINTARAAWRETLRYQVTYCKRVAPTSDNSIALAAVRAEHLFPLFRQKPLSCLENVRWEGTTRMQPYLRGQIKTAGLLVVPLLVSYRHDCVEALK